MMYRLRFLGKVLSVERASKPRETRKIQEKESRTENDPAAIDDKSRLGSYLAGEPIAQRLGVNYPFPPHLEYVFKFYSFSLFYSIWSFLAQK